MKNMCFVIGPPPEGIIVTALKKPAVVVLSERLRTSHN